MIVFLESNLGSMEILTSAALHLYLLFELFPLLIQKTDNVCWSYLTLF